MLATAPKSSRSCPLFGRHPKAFDRHSNNCGSCLHYNLSHTADKHNRACKHHNTLLNWIENNKSPIS